MPFHVGDGGIWEFVNNMDGPAFLERELVGLGVEGYLYVRVHNCVSGTVPIYIFREHLTYFSNVKYHTQSHQLPFHECWSVCVIHKLPDATPNQLCRQYETANQLVLKSHQFPGINIQ